MPVQKALLEVAIQLRDVALQAHGFVEAISLLNPTDSNNQSGTLQNALRIAIQEADAVIRTESPPSKVWVEPPPPPDPRTFPESAELRRF